MTGELAGAVFDVLVVDDDEDNLKQFMELMPKEIDGHRLAYEYTNDFGEALERLKRRRYDILVSDIYRAREKGSKNIADGDMKARDLVEAIRQSRFCPIVLFTDGQMPEELTNRPFVWASDKGGADFIDKVSANIRKAIQTGLPEIAKNIHDEIDRFAGSYVWQFLGSAFPRLRDEGNVDRATLERIIRRRAAIQLARIDSSGDSVAEFEHVDPADLYIYPPIGKFMRLGEIIRRKDTSEYRIVLTPHCHLIKQPTDDKPRAGHVLTALVLPAKEVAAAWKWPNNDKDIAISLRKRISIPAGSMSPPEGRYCFLPGFLDIPDSYCDLMQLESLVFTEVEADFERLAVLDQPYAEAVQACMSKLYGSVGLPLLDPDRLQHITKLPPKAAAASEPAPAS